MNNTPENNSITSVSHPERWELNLRIGATDIDYNLFTRSADNSLINGSANLERSADSYLKRVENLFYDIPILVDEYAKVNVIFDSQSFVIVPFDLCNDDNYEALFRASFPEFDGDILVSSLSKCNISIIYGIDKGVISFINRTYLSVTFNHSFTTLCNFFYNRSKLGNGSKLNVTIIGSKIFISAFRKQQLLLANSFYFRHINDAAFYILGIWKELGFDVLNDELQISGDSQNRKELIPILRKYISFVMPSHFPNSLLKIGNKATDVSFDLMLLSLCE